MSDQSGQRAGLLIAAIAATALLGAAGTGFIRDYAKERFLKAEPPHIAPAMKGDAAKWLDALLKGEAAKAVAIASKIAPPPPSFEMPRPEYLGFIADSGVRLGFLTDPFNFADYVRWRDLLDMKALADELSKGKDKPVKSLFEGVMGKLANMPQDASRRSPPLSAMDPWREGKGNSSDRLRLLCALASQAGCDCVVIGVFKKWGQVLRELCEIRRGSEVWLADTASGALWEGMDIAALAARPDLVPKDWIAEEAAALKGPHVALVPSEPQDFRACAILLYSRLAPLGAEGLPSLPQDPQARLQSRIALGIGNEVFSYWRVPWMSLHSIKGDPAGWLVEKESK